MVLGSDAIVLYTRVSNDAKARKTTGDEENESGIQPIVASSVDNTDAPTRRGRKEEIQSVR